MKNMVLKGIIIAGLINHFSCSDNVTKEELQKYIANPDNGLCKRTNVKGLNYCVIYKPNGLIAYKELVCIGDDKPENVDSIRRKYREYTYFSLLLSECNTNIVSYYAYDNEKYNELVQLFSFYMKEKIFLYGTECDTLYPVDVIYTPDYGMKRETELLIVFPEIMSGYCNNFILQIGDIGLETGRVNFRFYMKDFNNLPELIIP